MQCSARVQNLFIRSPKKEGQAATNISFKLSYIYDIWYMIYDIWYMIYESYIIVYVYVCLLPGLICAISCIKVNVYHIYLEQGQIWFIFFLDKILVTIILVLWRIWALSCIATYMFLSPLLFCSKCKYSFQITNTSQKNLYKYKYNYEP